MGAVLRDTTLFDNLHVKKFITDARDRAGRVVPIPFELTVTSVSTVADTYNVCVIPANSEVVGLECVTDGLGASAGAGRTFALGDADDNDRYVVAADFDVAEARAHLAFAGQRFRPAKDTTVVALSGGGAWVVGKKVRGCFYVVPGA